MLPSPGDTGFPLESEPAALVMAISWVPSCNMSKWIGSFAIQLGKATVEDDSPIGEGNGVRVQASPHSHVGDKKSTIRGVHGCSTQSSHL